MRSGVIVPSLVPSARRRAEASGAGSREGEKDGGAAEEGGRLARGGNGTHLDCAIADKAEILMEMSWRDGII